jgi:hypothetical protein
MRPLAAARAWRPVEGLSSVTDATTPFDRLGEKHTERVEIQ